ncbi:MAG TPA: hypothetical protein VLC51_04600 [Nitrospira sp.]|nr:hypothetical protein [Nitrospira sp.]
MGCDIHPAIEYKDANGWHAIMFPNRYYAPGDKYEAEFTARLDVNRDYNLFAVLGNVRNGYGFAGTPTGKGFVPMSDNRGVPDDISDEAKSALSGEHSATWVTLTEILAYDWDRFTTHTGTVNPATFAKWDRMREWNPVPDSWSGGVSGRGVKYVSNDEMRQAIKDDPELANDGGLFCKSGMYTVIEWQNSYSDDCKQMWTKILPKMLNLGREHGYDNVRLVMDFDS